MAQATRAAANRAHKEEHIEKERVRYKATLQESADRAATANLKRSGWKEEMVGNQKILVYDPVLIGKDSTDELHESGGDLV